MHWFTEPLKIFVKPEIFPIHIGQLEWLASTKKFAASDSSWRYFVTCSQNTEQQKWKRRKDGALGNEEVLFSIILDECDVLFSRKELEQKTEKSDCELLEAQRSLEQEKLAR